MARMELWDIKTPWLMDAQAQNMDTKSRKVARNRIKENCFIQVLSRRRGKVLVNPCLFLDIEAEEPTAFFPHSYVRWSEEIPGETPGIEQVFPFHPDSGDRGRHTDQQQGRTYRSQVHLGRWSLVGHSGVLRFQSRVISLLPPSGLVSQQGIHSPSEMPFLQL